MTHTLPQPDDPWAMVITVAGFAEPEAGRQTLEGIVATLTAIQGAFAGKKDFGAFQRRIRQLRRLAEGRPDTEDDDPPPRLIYGPDELGEDDNG